MKPFKTNVLSMYRNCVAMLADEVMLFPKLAWQALFYPDLLQSFPELGFKKVHDRMVSNILFLNALSFFLFMIDICAIIMCTIFNDLHIIIHLYRKMVKTCFLFNFSYILDIEWKCFHKYGETRSLFSFSLLIMIIVTFRT